MATEQLRGDPEDLAHGPAETLTLSDTESAAIEKWLAPNVSETESGAAPPKDAKTLFTQFVLAVAGQEADAHVSRDTNRPRVTEYLNLFGLDFADENGRPYAFCAAGLGWAACKAFCQMDPQIPFGAPPTPVFRPVAKTLNTFYFLPHPSCLNMVARAKEMGNWVRPGSPPLPGWLVFYNWAGGATPEHVGIVEAASATILRTVEFNTSVVVDGSRSNGGVVARKNRDGLRQFVIGYIATHSMPAA